MHRSPIPLAARPRGGPGALGAVPAALSVLSAALLALVAVPASSGAVSPAPGPPPAPPPASASASAPTAAPGWATAALGEGPPPGKAVSDRAVLVDLVHPVEGGATTPPVGEWLHCRSTSSSECGRVHEGIDLYADKLTPALAAFDGTVVDVSLDDADLSGNWLELRSDDGRWTAVYVHLNNDTPGTDDGRGTSRWAVVPGLREGVQVRAGQHLGWIGDSGNAEGVGPHIHFALRDAGGVNYDPTASVDAAPVLPVGHDVVPLPSVGVERSPLGSLDAVEVVGPREVRVLGWALDPDAWRAPATVEVLLDGVTAAEAPAAAVRDDVFARYGYGAERGFDVALPTGSDPRGGLREVCVAVRDDTGAQPDAELGCATVPQVPLRSRVVRAAPGSG